MCLGEYSAVCRQGKKCYVTGKFMRMDLSNICSGVRSYQISYTVHCLFDLVLSVCVSVCLSVYLSVCLSVCQSVCLSVCEEFYHNQLMHCRLYHQIISTLLFIPLNFITNTRCVPTLSLTIKIY